jgi:tetratricopeptide (TPR) repeat protein
MQKKIWPVIVSGGSVFAMLVSFFIPSIQDQWDRFQSRKVVEKYVALGDDFFNEERYDMAEKAFEKAFDISEQKRLDIEIKRLRSKINRETMEPLWGAKPPDSIEEVDFQYVLHLQKKKNQSKDRIVTLNSYGVFLSSQHRNKEAEDAFSEAIKLDSTNVLAYVNCGNLYDGLGKKDLAGRFYGKAISLDPENERAHYNLGLLLSEQGKLAEALAEFQSALKYDSTDTDAVRECRSIMERLK